MMRTPTAIAVRAVVAMATLAVAAAGCATTQQVKVRGDGYCAFLGSQLCARLTMNETPGRLSGAAIAGSGEAVAGLRYINPSAKWTQYRKILIAPVTFWGGDDTKVSPEDQHMLTDYFHQAIEEQLSKHFEIVQRPGPGVLTLQAWAEQMANRLAAWTSGTPPS